MINDKYLIIENSDIPELYNQVIDIKKELQNLIMPENETDLQDLSKNLKTIEKKLKEKRKEFFKDLTENQKNIISLEKLLIEKSKEADAIILELNKKEIEEIQLNNENAVNNFIEKELKIITEQSQFKNEIIDFVNELKNKNILTPAGNLKKPEKEKITSFIGNFEVAEKTLSKVGLLEFKRNGFSITKAIGFQREVVEAELLEKEKEIKIENEKVTVVKVAPVEKKEIQEMKELVTNVTSAATTESRKKVRYLKFEYADNLALEIKKLVKELVKKGVEINMSENKEEL